MFQGLPAGEVSISGIASRIASRIAWQDVINEGSKCGDGEIQDAFGIVHGTLNVLGKKGIAPAVGDLPGQGQPGIDLGMEVSIVKDSTCTLVIDVGVTVFDLVGEGNMFHHLSMGVEGKILPGHTVFDAASESHRGRRNKRVMKIDEMMTDPSKV